MDVRCDCFVVLRVWGTDIQIFGQQSIAKRAIRSIVVINKLGARRALASRQVTISAFSVSQAVHASLGRTRCVQMECWRHAAGNRGGVRASTDRAGEMGPANVKTLFSSYGYLIRRQPVIACPVVLQTGNKRASANVRMAQNHPHARARAETVARARTHGKLRTADRPTSKNHRNADGLTTQVSCRCTRSFGYRPRRVLFPSTLTGKLHSSRLWQPAKACQAQGKR